MKINLKSLEWQKAVACHSPSLTFNYYTNGVKEVELPTVREDTKLTTAPVLNDVNLLHYHLNQFLVNLNLVCERLEIV